MFAGYPASEMEIKGSTQIKQLSKEEIEGLRLACQVSNIFSCTGSKSVAEEGIKKSLAKSFIGSSQMG